MTDDTATAAPEAHVDWRAISDAVDAYTVVRAAHPAGAPMDAGETLRYISARDNFRRVVTPEAVRQLIGITPAVEHARTIGALQTAVDTMEKSADEIRDVLAAGATATGKSLSPWLRHTVNPTTGQPCLAGRRDDPQPCICGLADALMAIGLPDAD